MWTFGGEVEPSGGKRPPPLDPDLMPYTDLTQLKFGSNGDTLGAEWFLTAYNAAYINSAVQLDTRFYTLVKNFTMATKVTQCMCKDSKIIFREVSVHQGGI